MTIRLAADMQALALCFYSTGFNRTRAVHAFRGRVRVSRPHGSRWLRLTGATSLRGPCEKVGSRGRKRNIEHPEASQALAGWTLAPRSCEGDEVGWKPGKGTSQRSHRRRERRPCRLSCLRSEPDDLGKARLEPRNA